MFRIGRREFIKCTFGTLLSSVIPKAYSMGTRPRRPNILWISCEDISPHLGCYSEELAITPHMDRLATEGVRYTNAFTVHGVCAPSRSGIITGMYPSALGSVNMRCRAQLPPSIRCFTEYLIDAGYYCTNNDKEDYNFETPDTAWHESGRQAHWKKRPTGMPFFSVFNFRGTHESKLWNSVDFSSTHPEALESSQWQNPEKMTVPPIYPDTIEVRKDMARLFERITEFDLFVKERIDELKKADLYEDTVIFVWSDHGDGLPRAKRWLYDSGTRVPLIVRIPKQFRTGNQAQPDTVDDRFVNFIDLAPTVLNLAHLAQPSYMQAKPFLGSNLPAERQYIFGARQRIDEVFDMVRSVRDQQYRYLIHFMPFVPYLPYLAYREKCNTMKAMRKYHEAGKLNDIQAQWLADSRPSEELYDLNADPWETVNLARDPKYAAVKQQLRKVLTDWMLETLDTGLLPEPELVREAKQYGAEYQIFRQKNGPQRAAKLLKLALLCSAPEPSHVNQILAGLEDPDPAARYWAALAMREPATIDTRHVDTLIRLNQDSSPVVQTAAAWSLHLAGQKEVPVHLIRQQLTDSAQSDEALHFALHVLDSFGPESRPALDAVQTLYKQRGESKYIGRICRHFIEKYSSERKYNE